MAAYQPGARADQGNERQKIKPPTNVSGREGASMSLNAVRPGSPAERAQQLTAKAEGENRRQAEEQKRRQQEKRRFWIQTAIAAVAALASIAGVILQLA